MIDQLDAILKSDKKLSAVIKKELAAIRNQFADARRTAIQEKIEEIKVDLDILVPSEEVIVSVTKDGYVKRTSVRSYGASNGAGQDMKESDYSLLEAPMNTQHHLLLFTSAGNYIYQPVHELPDIRWKDLGQHISSIITLGQDETIVAAIGIESFDEEACIVTASKNGLIKMSKLADYPVQRYSRAFKGMGIKKDDTMIDARLVKGDEDVILFTHQAYGLRFPLSELSVTGIRTAGVKGINLKDEDQVVAMEIVSDDERSSILIATQRGTVKRIGLKELDSASRAQRGVVMLKELKTNPYRIIGAKMVKNDEIIVLSTDKGHKIPIVAGSLRLVDRYSNGSTTADEKKDGTVTHIYKDPKAKTE